MHLNMERLALGQLKDANIKFSNQIFPWYVRTQLCIPSSEYNRRTFRNGKSVGPWRWWGWEGCLVGPLEERNPAELGGGGGRRKSGNSISASYVIGLTEASSTAQLVLMTLHTSGSLSSSPDSSDTELCCDACTQYPNCNNAQLAERHFFSSAQSNLKGRHFCVFSTFCPSK